MMELLLYILLIVSREVYLQKSSIVDIRFGSKYASVFWRLSQRFISMFYFTSFNSSKLLLNI